MQKKILVSLLMTAPVGLTAFADINLPNLSDPNNWSVDGLSGEEYKPGFDGSNSLSSQIGAGVIWQKILLPKGIYRISFDTSPNLEIKVYKGDTEIEVTADSNQFTALDDSAEYTIKFSGKNKAMPFSYTGCQLVLVFDFEKEATELGRLRYKLLPGGVSSTSQSIAQPEEGVVVPDALKEKLADLEKTDKILKTKIETIKNSDSDSELLRMYGEEKLYNDVAPYADANMNSEIAAALKELKSGVDEYNAEIAKLNTAKENQDVKEQLLAAVNGAEGLREKLAALKTAIEAERGKEGYVDLQNCLGGTVVISDNIDGYVKEIETAYASDKLSGEIDFTPTFTYAQLDKQIDDLQAEFDADKADNAAFAAFKALQTGLKKEYDTAVTQISVFTGVEGMEDVYQSIRIPEWLSAVETIYNEAAAKDYGFGETVQKGDSAKLEAAQEGVGADIKALQEAVAGYKTIVDNQNEWMTFVSEDVAALKKELDDVIKPGGKDIVVPDMYKDEFDSKVKKITEDITTLLSDTEDAYKQQLLTKPEKDVEIRAEIAKLTVFVKPFATISNLMGELDTMIKTIAGMGKIPGTEETYASKFGTSKEQDGTYKNISDAILSLTTDSEGNLEESEVRNITDQISAIKTIADNLKKTYTDIKGILDNYKKALDGLVKYAEGTDNGKKIVLPEDSREALKNALLDGDDYKALNTDLSDFTDRRNAAAAFDGQKCYDDGKALLAELEADTWSEEISTLKNTFSGDVTEKTNFVNAENLLNNAGITAGIDEAGDLTKNYAGIEDMVQPLKNLRDELSAIKAEMDVASDAAAYDAVDVKLKALWSKIEKFNADIKNLLDNKAAYDELNGMLPQVGSDLDELKQYNDEVSVDNGKAFFADIIGEPTDADTESTLYGKLAKLKADLMKAYDTDYADARENASGLKKAFQERIEGLSKEIAETLSADQANNENHDGQLQRWSEVSAKLTGALTSLEGKDAVLVADWKAELEALRTNTSANDPDLVQISITIATAYGEGKSLAGNPEIMSDLQYISDEIDRILAEIGDEYPGMVDEHNNDIVASCDWTAMLAELQQTYTNSINTFNEFYYNLNNVGYREALKPEMKRHEGIYQYSQIIRELPGLLIEWLKTQKTNLHLITQDEFDAEWTAKAQSYINEMRGIVTAMNETANYVAESYYTTLHASAAGVISTAESKLQAAGINGKVAEDCLRSVKNAMENAEWANNEAQVAKKGWEDAQTWEEKAEFQKDLPGLAMDRIADLLDQILNPVNIDLQKAAQTAWGEVYPSQADLEVLRNIIVSECPDADPNLKSEQLAIFDNTVPEIKALGSSVDAITEGLIDLYAEKKAELDRLMDILNGCVDKVKESQQNATAEKDAYNGYLVEIGDLKTLYGSLNDYLEGFSQAYRVDAVSVKIAIDTLTEYVEKNRGRLTTQEVSEHIDDEVLAIRGTLAYMKQQISSLEYAYVGTTLTDRVKVAFNDAKVKTTGNEVLLNEINDRIDGIIKAVSDMDADFAASGFDFDAYKTAVLGYEADLCSIIQTLDAMWEGDKHESDPTQSAADRLDARYNEVATDIAAGQTELEGCLEEIKTKYESEYTDLKSRLDAVKTAWSDDGANIIAQEQNYMVEMNRIAAELEELDKEVKAANETAVADADKKAANEQAYSVLKGEYDNLVAEFEAVKTLIAGYGDNELAYYSFEISQIDDMLGKSLADLEEKYGDIGLDADSKLQDAETIIRKIAELKLASTGRYANSQLDLASIALQAASKSLQGYIVPDELKKLNVELKGLQDSYDAIKYNVAGADYERLTEIITEAQRIASEARTLADNASASKYVPGDVNLDPDGKVNSADVQMLINWVGEGMTYAQLYSESPRQACAADLTGDEVLDIADVTMDIQLALGMQPGQVRAKKFLGRVAGDNTFALQFVSEENGVKRYALVINNSAAFVAGQLDLKIGGGSEILDVKGGARMSAHDLYLFDGSFGAKRVLIASMANAEIEGNDGAVIYIDVEGNDRLEVEGVVFADSNAVAYDVKKAGTSLVDSIIDSAKEAKEKIYNVAGQTLNRLQRGINIVRKGNGKASKEMHK